MPVISSSEKFQGFMIEIWGEDPQELYPTHSDAVQTALYAGAIKLWSSRYDGRQGYVFEFLNGTRCFISTTGDMIKPVRRHRSREPA